MIGVGHEFLEVFAECIGEPDKGFQTTLYGPIEPIDEEIGPLERDHGSPRSA